jgi:hypothetical protein
MRYNHATYSYIRGYEQKALLRALTGVLITEGSVA